uniref:Uncharacterized protein n=1 Tax=Molossus molossus TaxID=27622 RepID=A0A7J8HHR2_MOLMO|nr:hypothetical protein HJG59_010959 [Molossus molossus]
MTAWTWAAHSQPPAAPTPGYCPQQGVGGREAGEGDSWSCPKGAWRVREMDTPWRSSQRSQGWTFPASEQPLELEVWEPGKLLILETQILQLWVQRVYFPTHTQVYQERSFLFWDAMPFPFGDLSCHGGRDTGRSAVLSPGVGGPFGD